MVVVDTSDQGKCFSGRDWVSTNDGWDVIGGRECTILQFSDGLRWHTPDICHWCHLLRLCGRLHQCSRGGRWPGTESSDGFANIIGDHADDGLRDASDGSGSKNFGVLSDGSPGDRHGCRWI